MVPDSLQIRRLGMRPGRGDQQVSAEIEHRFGERLQTVRRILLGAQDLGERHLLVVVMGLAETNADPVEEPAVVGDMTVKHRPRIGRPSVDGRAQPIGEHRHVPLRLFGAALEPAQAAEPKRQAGDARAPQNIIDHRDLAARDGEGEGAGIRHPDAVPFVLPWIIGDMGQRPDIESGHLPHDDEGGLTRIGIRPRRYPGLLEKSAGDAHARIDRRARRHLIHQQIIGSAAPCVDMDVGGAQPERFAGEGPGEVQAALHMLPFAGLRRVPDASRAERLVYLLVLLPLRGVLDDPRGRHVIAARRRLTSFGHDLGRQRRGLRMRIARPEGVVVEVQHIRVRFGAQDRPHATVAERDSFLPMRRNPIESEFHGATAFMFLYALRCARQPRG